MISLVPVWVVIIFPNLRQYLAVKSQKPKPQRRMSNADSQPQINSDPRWGTVSPSLPHPTLLIFHAPFTYNFSPLSPQFSVLQLNGKKKTFPTFSQGSEAAIGCPCNWVCKCGRWVVGGRWWEGSGSGIGSGFVVVGRQAALGYVDSVVWLLSVCSARQYWCTMNKVCIHLVLIKYVLRIWVKVLKLLKNYLCIYKNIKSFLSVHWLVFGRIIVKWPCTCRPFCF